MKPLTAEDCWLHDDGTLDTVVEVPGGALLRYDMETAADYRDPETGVLNFDLFVEEVVAPDCAATVPFDPDDTLTLVF